MKICKKCGGSEFYACGKCKPCQKAKSAAYYAEHAVEIKAAWPLVYAANSESIKARAAQWYADNPEVVKARSKQWTCANPEKHAGFVKNWATNNPETRRMIKHTRRAKERGGNGKLSKGLINKLMILQQGKCACCCVDFGKTTPHMDHMIALAAGGLNVDANIQLLCGPCNQSKGIKHPIDFMQSRGFLL